MKNLTYGISRANAYKILEDSLNLRDVRIYDTIEDADGKEPVSYTHLPLPELASSLSGNVPNYEVFMEALRRSAPVPITFEAWEDIFV